MSESFDSAVMDADSAAGIARTWGWDEANAEVLAAAEFARRVQDLSLAEALVEVGAVAPGLMRARMELEPGESGLVDWLERQHPETADTMHRIAASHAGYPYFERLDWLNLHAGNEREDVRRACLRCDALLMSSPKGSVVCVFSSIQSALRFAGAEGDALRLALQAHGFLQSGDTPLCAVAGAAVLARCMSVDSEQALHSPALDAARRWGWQQPGKDILALAALSMRMAAVDIGEALVVTGAISPERLAELDAKVNSSGIKTLEWYANSEPAVRAVADKVLTLRSGHPFYEALEVLTAYSVMRDGAVLNRCYELDAALMLIEGKSVVLVFSTYADMMRYATAGREERLQDPIRQKLSVRNAEVNLLLAVGKRDQVLAQLAAAKGSDVLAETNIVAMWYGASAVDKSERMIARILDHALMQGATDIAISPQRGAGSLVEMRRLGGMVPCPVAERLTVDEAAKIVDFLLAKSDANPNLSKVREPRDGNIMYRSTAGDAELRLSFIPINQAGEYLISVSIRLMARVEATIQLDRLQLEPQVRGQLAAAAKLSKGFVLLVGGTNTGKSTTVAGALEENFRHFGRARKRLSLEKPVERILRGVTQVNIPANMEDAFDRYLEAFKRHDPDVIFVGEILGPVTANAAVTAAVSGHLVFSTTHANDALLGYDSVSQMLAATMRYQFIESLSLIVAQDMVRDVCQACGQLHPPTREEVELFQAYCDFKSLRHPIPLQTMHIDRDGCRRCNHTGIVSILPINEVLPVTRAVKNAMFGMLDGTVFGPNGENRRDLIADARTSTLFESAMALVSAGRIELGDAIQ